MAERFIDFESGTHGSTLAADAGQGLTITTTGTGTIRSRTEAAIRGSLGCRCTGTGTDTAYGTVTYSSSAMTWRGIIGFKVRASNPPVTTVQTLVQLRSAAALAGVIVLTTGLQVAVQSRTGAQSGTNGGFVLGSALADGNYFVAAEVTVDTATTGTCHAILYSNTGTVLAETTKTTIDFAAAAITVGRFGKTAASGDATAADYDYFRSDTGSTTPYAPPPSVTMNAGADQSNVEPYTTVTLDSSASAGSTGRTWSQVSGSSATLSSTSATSPTFKAPGTLTGSTLVFRVTDTASGVFDEVSVTVLASARRMKLGGVMVPIERRVQIAVAPQVGLQSVRWADNLVDSWGVNIHTRNTSGTYANYQAVHSWLVDLGARWVRDRFAPNNNQPAAWALFRDSGIKVLSTLIVYNAEQTLTDIRAVRDQLLALFPDPTVVVGMLAGPNEPNNETGGRLANWATILHTQMTNLRTALSENPATAPIPLASPGFKDVVTNLGGDYSELAAVHGGTMESLIDYGDFHRYPAGGLPSSQMAARKTSARAAWGASIPFIQSEGGYQDRPDQPTWGNGVSQQVDAIYTVRHLAEAVWRGTKRFFEYELLDDPDPKSDVEHIRGMIDTPSADPATWTAKPAFTALKRLFALMGDPGSTPALPQMGMDVTSAASDLHYLVFGKRDGTRQVVMWREVSVWTVQSGQNPTGFEVFPAAVDVTVTVDVARTAAVYDPVSSAAPVTSFGSAFTFTVPVAGRLLVLNLV